MAEQDALSGAKFGGGLFLNEFPVKIRVLTLDPMVYRDNFANTRYAFIVYNLDEDRVQIVNKGPSFARRFQEIHLDPDYGGDIRKIDVKVTVEGKGKNTRYTIMPVGNPHDLTQEQVKTISDAKIDLEAIIKKSNPGALRLSEVNEGAKIESHDGVEPTDTQQDVVIEDVGDEPINLDDIPF